MTCSAAAAAETVLCFTAFGEPVLGAGWWVAEGNLADGWDMGTDTDEGYVAAWKDVTFAGWSDITVDDATDVEELKKEDNILNSCHAESIKRPCPLLIFSQSDY